MHLLLVGDSALDSAARLVEQAGKGPLSLVALFVLVLAFLVFKFFARDSLKVRVGAFFVIVACIFAFVFTLVVPRTASPEPEPKPLPKNPVPDKTPEPSKAPAPPPPVQMCAKSRDLPFVPTDPGIMPLDAQGHHIALGEGGGGTTREKWLVSWNAPGPLIAATCSVGGYEHVLGYNNNGNHAECWGDINGGRDVITMHVQWNEPCS